MPLPLRGECHKTAIVNESRESPLADPLVAGILRDNPVELGDAEQEQYPIEVTPLPYAAGDAYIVSAGGHRWIVDQPREEGGSGLGATPMDTVIGGLASCIACHAGRYLTDRRVGRDGLRILVDYALAEDSSRVDSIRIRIVPPEGFPEADKDEFLAAIEDCRAQNSFSEPPGIRVEIAPPDDHDE